MTTTDRNWPPVCSRHAQIYSYRVQTVLRLYYARFMSCTNVPSNISTVQVGLFENMFIYIWNSTSFDSSPFYIAAVQRGYIKTQGALRRCKMAAQWSWLNDIFSNKTTYRLWNIALDAVTWHTASILERNTRLFVHDGRVHSAHSMPSGGQLWSVMRRGGQSSWSHIYTGSH